MKWALIGATPLPALMSSSSATSVRHSGALEMSRANPASVQFENSAILSVCRRPAFSESVTKPDEYSSLGATAVGARVLHASGSGQFRDQRRRAQHVQHAFQVVGQHRQAHFTLRTSLAAQ